MNYLRLALLLFLSACVAESRGGVAVQKATFAAGCFWGVESSFRAIPGVVSTRVGYAGGKTKNPTYKDVCTDKTGHAEAVEVTYDPSKVPYEKLLEAFWNLHDPTQVDRQGPDFGSQYRSVIFFHSPEQEAVAKAAKEKLAKSGKYRRPIATEIVPAGDFWQAEDYHQQYLEKRGLSNCHLP
jgi:peptide-methionine (S)-S-oxide reductase